MAGKKAELTPLGLVGLVFIPTLIILFSSRPYLPAAIAQSNPTIAPRVRVILDDNCLSCHGETRMSGLDLRQRDTTLKGGTRGPALVPGDPDASLLYKAAVQKGDLKMPMGRPRLSESDLQALRDWIKEGAPWDTGAVQPSAPPAWWSFRKPQRPAVPHVKDASWVRTPIDAFILSKLEQKGLKPAPPADKRTLIRRAYFDLIGLPPKPEDVKRFVEDKSPDAFTNVVEKLLESHH